MKTKKKKIKIKRKNKKQKVAKKKFHKKSKNNIKNELNITKLLIIYDALINFLISGKCKNSII